MLTGLAGFATSVVAFVIVIGVLVVIHEWGHYIMSKRAGVPVEEFAIGFGPVLAKLGRRAETVFTLRAFPVGGFVRTVGMEPGDETPGGYNMQPLWNRAKIISAGAIINLIFGFLVVVALGLTYGIPSGVGVHEVQAGSPAEAAGLKAGDAFVSINGTPVNEPTDLQKVIQANPGTPVQLLLRRDGGEVALTAIPKAVEQGGKTVGQLGFQMSNEQVWLRYGVVGSIEMGWKRSVKMVTDILHNLFSSTVWRERQLGGPILIAQAAGGFAQMGLQYFLWFMALLSINLGVLNLLPMPVLDGGHLVLLGIEAVRRRRPSPGFVMAFQGVGMAILFLFFVFIMASDIARLRGG